MTAVTCPEDTYVMCDVPATMLPEVQTSTIQPEFLPATGQPDPTTALGVSLLLIAAGLATLTLATMAKFRRADREEADAAVRTALPNHCQECGAWGTLPVHLSGCSQWPSRSVS